MNYDFAKGLRAVKQRAGLKQPVDGEVLDAELARALGDFRLSVHAWSDAAYSRPRTTMAAATRRRVWRLATGWVLGCVLVTGSGVWGGVRVVHHRREIARIAAVKQAIQQAEAAERQRLVAEQQARDEEELLAKVDSDVSRTIPSAMEPLAQLMAEDESK